MTEANIVLFLVGFVPAALIVAFYIYESNKQFKEMAEYDRKRQERNR